MRIYEASAGVFGDRGWKRITFWRWLWMRCDFVTRVRNVDRTTAAKIPIYRGGVS